MYYSKILISFLFVMMAARAHAAFVKTVVNCLLDTGKLLLIAIFPVQLGNKFNNGM